MFRYTLPTSLLACALLLVFWATGCTREDPPPLRLSVDTSDVQTQQVAHVLEETDGLDTLTVSLQRAQLLDELRRDGPFTVFAPVDQAFATVPGRIDSLLKARNDSTRLLLAHHLARGRYDSSRVGLDTLLLSTLAAQPVKLYRPSLSEPLHVDGRPVQRTIRTGNGIIYVIESLLALPEPDSTGAGALSASEQ